MYEYFWGGPFSQWASAPFIIDDIEFNTCEQYMMYKKAMLFGDLEVAEQILQTSDPKAQKALGRKVRYFDDNVWMEHAYNYVVEGNRAKFSQNREFGEVLAMTKGKTLVEASPYDCRWGIGLYGDDPRAKDPLQWRGENLLGKAITQVRIELFGD